MKLSPTHLHVRLTACLLGGIVIVAGNFGTTVAAGPRFVAKHAFYSFVLLDNQHDPTFNRLLGVNDHGVIAGYYGSGAKGHPSRGYTLSSPYTASNYGNENVPGARQTQVTGISNNGTSVGFWANGKGQKLGFMHRSGKFVSVVNPKTRHSHGANELLGVNSHGIAVGFYDDSSGTSHAYMYNVGKKKFSSIIPPGAVSAQATGIDDNGDIAGSVTETGGAKAGFLKQGKTFTTIAFPGSLATAVFGVADSGEIVGSYVDFAGNTNGFVELNGSFETVDDPNSLNETVVNGVNSGGEIVGYYVDPSGYTHGFLATQ